MPSLLGLQVVFSISIFFTIVGSTIFKGSQCTVAIFFTARLHLMPRLETEPRLEGITGTTCRTKHRRAAEVVSKCGHSGEIVVLRDTV